MKMDAACLAWVQSQVQMELQAPVAIPFGASQMAQVVNNLHKECRRLRRCGFDPWVRKIAWRRKWQPTPVFLPGKFHGQRSLVGYSPWSQQESDMTEWLSTHAHSLSFAWLPTLPQPRLQEYWKTLGGKVGEFCKVAMSHLPRVEVSNWGLQFSRSVMSNSLQPHEPQYARPPCPSPTSRVHPNPCPLCRWCHPTISSSFVPFSSCPQSFPALGSFQMSQISTAGGQSIGVSASTSVPPVNTQDWSPLGWTDWISLQFKGLSRVFSNTTVQKHQFFCTQLCL